MNTVVRMDCELAVWRGLGWVVWRGWMFFLVNGYGHMRVMGRLGRRADEFFVSWVGGLTGSSGWIHMRGKKGIGDLAR